MPRPTASLSRRPFPLNLLIRAVAFLGSAALATVVIAASAVVLAWATWLESRWGTPAVQFGAYQSTWFAVLMGLLGVNVLSATIVRIPWRKKQTGFLLVHAGILMLLVGCWLTQKDGVDGQMSLLEGGRSSTVLESGHHFELSISEDGETNEVTIPFNPGPFNWDDYRRLGWFPWSLVDCDRGVIYDSPGVKLETIDYYSDSSRVHVPEVKLRVAHGPAADKKDTNAWEPVTLAVSSFGGHRNSPHGTRSVGAWRELSQGEIALFRMATTRAETEAFLDSRPQDPLGQSGQIVLYAGGKKFHFQVDDLEGKPPVALGDSGLSVKLQEFDRKSLRVVLATYCSKSVRTNTISVPQFTLFNSSDSPQTKKPKFDHTTPAGALVLHGFQINLDQQDLTNGVFGSFWFDPYTSDTSKDTDPAVSRPLRIAASRPRLDILQGHNQTLYYRTWRAPRVGAIAELPTDGSKTVVFSPATFKPGNDKNDEKSKDDLIPATIYVEKFTPAQQPDIQIRSLPFKKDGPKTPRVKVRLSMNGIAQEFWLANAADGDLPLRLLPDTVDLGFCVVLDDFERRLDPGTSRPAGYSSQIDFVKKQNSSMDGAGMDESVYEEDVIVSLNRPASFTDPADGRTYRFFQSSFAGPYRPGDPQFDQIIGGSRKSDELYQSTFSVSSDPGRQLKYAGCLMIVAGIAVMYYMKAYFFRRGGTRGVRYEA